MPYVLRKGTYTCNIHKGIELAAGGNNDVFLYPEYIEQYYTKDNLLEELILHEVGHAALQQIGINDSS